MRLVRFGPVGCERPGLIDNGGMLRDLSTHVRDITAGQVTPAELARLSDINPAQLPKVEKSVRLGMPFVGSPKFIAVGLNYVDHAAETGQAIPKEPVIFTKAISCLHGPFDDIERPRGSTKMDWEVELGVVIGKSAKYLDEARALEHIAGYCVVDDLSERSFQLERGGSWDKGKGCDTFGPIGPLLVTRDEVPDVQSLDMWLDVNGTRMQTGNTRNMIFGVAHLVSYISQFMTLVPGDIITTGTPPGVGMGKDPPVFLDDGDVIELGIAGLGTQRHKIISPETQRGRLSRTRSV